MLPMARRAGGKRITRAPSSFRITDQDAALNQWQNVAQGDAGVSQLFPIWQRVRLEVRGEAFNVLNRLNPSNPTATLNSANFGKILAASDPRIVQVAMKLVF